ncbi:hypothetical protein QYE76_069929 [Lolium multiflorum]|uniref:TF-B3 domain-containing protein n=1 Tax=Lolium multiflorum TaxID=4521 RepID=A0AAD8SHZ9_LOLMU|nr:hypothetical protein QYE76_069929 [Lolium multiflorum]
MSITLGAATKFLDDMMVNYSEWHTERAPQGKKVNSVEETSSLSDKIDVIMSMLVNGRSNVDPNNVHLASLVAQEENVDVNFIKNNNFNNNAYRNNSGVYPLEAMLKEFISTQTAFNKSVEEKLDKIDILASKVGRLASDVDLLKLKVMPNKDNDNKIVTTENAIQVRINENIRLMAELHARWEREENEKLAKENNVAKVWTITATSNDNALHVAKPPTINGKIVGVGNVCTPSAKRAKLPEIAKTAETACDKTAEFFSNIGDNDPIAVDHNGLDFDDCHISEVIKFLQKLARSPNASAINLAFTKHITNALIKAREEKLKLETSIPRKLEDGWEPIIKMRVNDFDCNALCDLGASISVMPKKIYDMLDLPPLKNCYLDVNLADNAIKKPLGRIDNVRIMLLEVVAEISIARVLHFAENYCDGLLVLTDAEERLAFPLPVVWGYLVLLPRALQRFDLMVLPAEDFPMKEEEEIEQEGFAKMDRETAAFPDLLDFEFFVIIFQNPWEKLKLPDKFAKLLDGQEPREVTLREASGGRHLWNVEVLFDGEGRMYLDRGWERFARAHDLGLGNFLVFSYDGDAVLTVKVFDGSMCRRHYHDDDEENTGSGASSESGSNNSVGSFSNAISDSAKKSSSTGTAEMNISDSARKNSSAGEMNIDDALTSQFTVTLKPSHLGARQKQYLNVPPAFQHAHGYDSRSEVVLRMRGEKWTVTLKHNIRKGGHRTRASLRYGWHQFCVDNRLGVGDVCFFRALRGDGGGDDHALKVEVRQRNGTFLD